MVAQVGLASACGGTQLTLEYWLGTCVVVVVVVLLEAEA